MAHSNHPFHLVDMSPWPIAASFGALGLTTGLSLWFHRSSMLLMILSLLLLSLISFYWWRDVSREGSYQGLHSKEVIANLRIGMILFIVSEVFFFLSFFWAFFHASLAPSVELGVCWPPQNIQPFNPFQVPLLNTAILLSSGVSVTWCHHSLMQGDFSEAKTSLATTILLGIYFTCVQLFEYVEASFTISDSVFGSSFFVATGFHGLHVIIGTIFLTVGCFRLLMGHFSSNHHFGFEAAAWYWHFVDVVWLFLYVSLYWWGG